MHQSWENNSDIMKYAYYFNSENVVRLNLPPPTKEFTKVPI